MPHTCGSPRAIAAATDISSDKKCRSPAKFFTSALLRTHTSRECREWPRKYGKNTADFNLTLLSSLNGFCFVSRFSLAWNMTLAVTKEENYVVGCSLTIGVREIGTSPHPDIDSVCIFDRYAMNGKLGGKYTARKNGAISPGHVFLHAPSS